MKEYAEYEGKYTGLQIDDALNKALNALPRDGFADMTGNLHVTKNIPSVYLNTGKGKLTICKNATDAVDYHSFIQDTGSTGKTIDSNLDGDNQSVRVVLNGGVYHNILHTGNKPSGSYTGNGSAAERTIATGGIGKCCMVYGGTGEVAYLVPIGAFFHTNGVATFTSDVWFDNGVIYLRNAYIINMNGTTYNYQVL